MGNDPVTERDDLLANLLAEMSERQRRGEAVDVEAIALAHPELGDELRQLWAMAQLAAAFVSSPTILHTPSDTTTETPRPDSFGDYEILEELGRGGMGVVYLARQRSLGRLVAIKMMRDARLSSESDRARFLAEAEAAAKLKHPNIVTVFEVGHEVGLPYIVMEYIAGETLAQRLADGPLPSRPAARLVAEAARAVHHAHEHHILHRDLKPANVLLPERETDSSSGDYKPDRDGQRIARSLKITDFGLAKRLSVAGSLPDLLTQTGAVVGTPAYMAPEQASRRKDLGPPTDVYALGAILFECLTGRPPFIATNPVDALMMAVEQEPVPPRLIASGIDRDLEMICLKCLQKPPSLRYATAAELAEDLDHYLAGEPLASPPSGLGYFFSRMLRETHHVAVLENWGVLWMWHSLATFTLCLLTQILAWSGVQGHSPYLMLWSIGLIAWGTIFWQFRRRAGPVLFVERQIAHAWAAGVAASIATFIIEVMMHQPPLTLSPVIAMAAGMVFVFKAGILSGKFYLTAAAMFLTALVMPLVPQYQILLFGFVTACSFFFPGLKFYKLRKRSLALD
jgi:serine/threonine protein kinase